MAEAEPKSDTAKTDETPTLADRLRELYRGNTPTARRFRFGLLAFDIFTILFFVGSSFVRNEAGILIVDVIIALFILADYAARFVVAPRKIVFATHLTNVADVIVIVSLLSAFVIESLAFLRVVRALRLMRSYHVLRDLREQSPFFQRNEEVIQSIVNLAVFIYVMTAIVYVMQVDTNPAINTYLDALYFTITTLTTTGFGDITLSGTEGRLLAVVIMIVGVSLFLRLVQTLFRPTKVRYECPDCGLNQHDPDAVHCKHCGRVVHIGTEGHHG